MIVPKRRSWLRIVLSLRDNALTDVWPRVLVVTIVSIVVTAVHHETDAFHKDLTVVPFTLISVALGIFLGFRNNTSYDRFWEGRRLWGGIVNTSRNLCRQILTMVDEADGDLPPGEHRLLVQGVIAFVHGLRTHLREEPVELDRMRVLLPEKLVARLPSERNVPYAIAHWLGEGLAREFREGRLNALHLPILEASLSTLVDLQGGCERIKATPMPFSYTKLIHRIVAFYCFGLPFGLVNTTGLATPVVVTMVAYAFFGLDAVGDQIEDPFGNDPEDLPLSAISTTIETNLRQRLGDTELPEPIAPVREILM